MGCAWVVLEYQIEASHVEAGDDNSAMRRGCVCCFYSYCVPVRAGSGPGQGRVRAGSGLDQGRVRASAAGGWGRGTASGEHTSPEP